MDIKRWIILASIVVFSFAIYQAADAKVLSTTIVSFDKETLERGYTVKSADGSLMVPIFPKYFQNKLTVKISEQIVTPALPNDKVAVSGYYIYDFRTGKPGFLDKPATIAFKLAKTVDSGQQVYFYDKAKNLWRPLPTTIDEKNNLVRTKTIFPYAMITVLENAPGELTAQSAIVVDSNTGKVVFEKNVNQVRSVASLTKLVSVLVFLDHNPGWKKEIIMQKSDFVGGATLWVKAGDTVTVKDLFYSTLVGSKNNTTEALARVTGLTRPEFISAMNKKVKDLGLLHSKFVEPTGLDENNVSTASEMAIIAREAFSREEVYQATTTGWYKVKPKNSQYNYWVKNTSQKVLQKDLILTGTKTGWTDEAGYCLVSKAKTAGKELIALVLGAKVTKNYVEVYDLLKNNL